MSDLQSFPPDPSPVRIPRVAPSVARIELGAPVPGEEELIWQGHPAFAASVFPLLRSAVFGMIWLLLFLSRGWLLVIPEVRPAMQRALEGTPFTPELVVRYASYALVFFMLLNLLRFGRNLLLHVNTTYRITTQRIVIRTGILSIRSNQIELFRLKDYQVNQSLWARLCGYAQVYLVSSDRLLPRVLLWGLPNGEQVTEVIRRACQFSRAQSGSVSIGE